MKSFLVGLSQREITHNTVEQSLKNLFLLIRKNTLKYW